MSENCITDWRYWLKCITPPLLKVLKVPLNGALWGLPVGDFVEEAALHLMQTLEDEKHRTAPQQALVTLANAPETEVCQEAAQFILDRYPHLSAEDQNVLSIYLSQIPVKIRQALRRPED